MSWKIFRPSKYGTFTYIFIKCYDHGTFGTGLTFAPTKYNIVSIDDHNHDGTRKTHRTQLEY